MYIYDPISLLAFSMCHQWPGKAGLQHLSLLCCSWHFEVCLLWSSSPVDEARPKTDYKHNDSVQCPLLKFLHKEVGYHMGRERMRCHSSHLFIQTQTRRRPSKCHNIIESSTLWQCVARQVSPGSLKDLHPSVTNEPQPLLTHTMHMGIPQRLACSATPL